MVRKQVFEGIKVADFSWIMVGPTVSRILAEHGATVVRVESHSRPDMCRIQAPFRDFIPGVDRAGLFPTNNTNKYGISLDVSKPSGKKAALKLIEWADIVTDSFIPGTMDKLGLGYEEAKKINPNIIYYSTSSQGQDGPYAKFAAYGAQSAALAGLSLPCGRPDHDPVHLYGAYTDFIAPWYLLVAVIGALDRLRKTGKGMYIDQSQVEAGVTMMAPQILDYSINGRVVDRMGNRDLHAAPHGAYKCQGNDRWITIAVFTEQQWQDFSRAIGEPEWVKSLKFGTLADRKLNEDELDRLVSEWTADKTLEQVMQIMQSAGVPAGIVNKMEDIFNDPQLQHREHFVHLEHKVIGRHAYHNESIRFSKTPPEFKKAGPCLGEDNEYVYKELLGLTDDEIADMYVEGAITTENDLPAVAVF